MTLNTGDRVLLPRAVRRLPCLKKGAPPILWPLNPLCSPSAPSFPGAQSFSRCSRHLVARGHGLGAWVRLAYGAGAAASGGTCPGPPSAAQGRRRTCTYYKSNSCQEPSSLWPRRQRPPPECHSQAPFPQRGLEQRPGLPNKPLSKVGLLRIMTNPQGLHDLTGRALGLGRNSGDSPAALG